MIKGVLFDLGGVLIDNPAEEMKSYIMNLLDVSPDKLQSLTSPLMPLFQKGMIEEGEFWKRVFSEIPMIDNLPPSIWTEAIKRSYSPRDYMFTLASDLKAHGLKIGILSNTEVPVVNFLSKIDFSIFDVLLYSCLEGTRKPEKEIYLLATKRMGVKAEELIFIDDFEENVQAGIENGMHSILYTSYSHFYKELEKLTRNFPLNNKY